jgi:hypothetical protein
LDTVKLRNGLVPDPEHLPGIMNKHFTEQMSDFVACPWSEGQGGDLDGEHSDLLTQALATLLGKQNDEAFGDNTMDTQWKLSFYQDLRRLDHPAGGSQRQQYHTLPNFGNQP